MPVINVNLNGDGAWPDLEPLVAEGKLIDLMGPAAPPIGVALVKGGMASGKSSVAIRLALPDGRVVITETSLALLANTVRAMQAATGETA